MQSETTLSQAPEPSFSEQFEAYIKFLGDHLYPRRSNKFALFPLNTNPRDTRPLSEEQRDKLYKALFLDKLPKDYQKEEILHFNMLALEGGFIKSEGSIEYPQYSFTAAGWLRYEEIKRKPFKSNLAFMAMPFGRNLNEFYVYDKEAKKYSDKPFVDESFELDSILQHFREAVNDTGFTLRDLRDDTVRRAGLIDEHIRVEIRKSNFIIAELTGDNPGAYFEAGFAEGLGNRPVIYTYHKDWKPHFDTRNLHTVFWHHDENNVDNLSRACDQLKAIIRNSLPDSPYIKM